MDLRNLKYFLAVVREGTISKASQTLHVAQPSLSRQMKELEEKLGVSLFVRGNRRITLTAEGLVLRKRAEEMLRLMQITKDEITEVKQHIAGTVRIGAGESYSFHYLSKAMAGLAQEHPGLHFKIRSGDTSDLMEELHHGLLDCAVIFTPIDHEFYEAIELPCEDSFGLLMRKDSPLCTCAELKLSDLTDLPLIVPRAAETYFVGLTELPHLKIVATYNLIYNASLLVEDGLGYAICFDKLINTSGTSKLCLRPMHLQLTSCGYLIFKKFQILSPAVELFIDRIKTTLKQK